MLGMTTTEDARSTAIKEISEALGGGIREGSLVLIEGDAKSGKSVLSQYIAYGILCSKVCSVAYYTTDYRVEDLIAQMDSLSLFVRKDFVTDRLRIYTMGSDDILKNIQKSFQPLTNHISELPVRFKLVMVDSLTPLMIRVGPVVKIDFLQACKEQLCDRQNRSVVLAADTFLFEGKTLYRAHAMSDYYLRLRSKDMVIDTGVDTRVVKVLDVTKLGGADRRGQEDIKFEIKPKIGMQILPLVQVKV